MLEPTKYEKFTGATLPYNPGVFLSYYKLADANDMAEHLEYKGYRFVRVGYRGIWIADKSILD